MESDLTCKDINECACKGIRTCLICENLKNEKKDSKIAVTDKAIENYFFCPTCEFLYADEKETLCTNHNKQNITRLNLEKIIVVKDFVSHNEENMIIAEIEKYPWKPSQSGRLKQDFGPKVNFKKKKVNFSMFNGLPNFTSNLLSRMTETIAALSDFQAVEVCNLCYVCKRGASIDPHIDDEWLWGERLVTLSLHSDTYLTLTHDDRDDINITIPMPARSLLILQGDARHMWKHSIQRQHILDDRLAVTFRELSTEFCKGGSNHIVGDSLLQIAKSFNGQPLYKGES